MFPSEHGSNHVKSYRKQFERVRSACQMPFVGFHHSREGNLQSWRLNLFCLVASQPGRLTET
jgi:hypothetical protein